MLARRLESLMPKDSAAASFGFVGVDVTTETMDVPKPTTYSAGDQLFLFMGSDSSNNLTPVNPPVGEGFTELRYRESNCTGVWTKTLTASEPTTYNFTHSNRDDRTDWIAIVLSGVTGWVTSTISTTRTAASITMPADGILYTFHTIENSSVGWSAPSGMAKLAEELTGVSRCGLATLDVSAGATGNRTATFSSFFGTDNSVSLGVY
jgi:hypothetical protein